MYLKLKNLCLVLLWFLSVGHTQGLNDQGLWGSQVIPSASVLPTGQWTAEISRQLPLLNLNDTNRVGGLGLGWNYVAFRGLEIGGRYQQEILNNDSLPRSDFHTLSIKYQFPRLNKWAPDLAFGWQSLAQTPDPWKHLFFSGGYQFGTRELGLRVDLNGQYIPVSRSEGDYELQSITGFASYLSLSEARLFVEFLYNGDQLVRNYGAWYSPFDEPDKLFESAGFSVGGGVRNYFDGSDSQWWVSAQLSQSSWSDAQKAFLHRSPEPFFYLWLSPAIDFVYDPENGYEQAYGIQQDWWIPLYEKQFAWRTSWQHFAYEGEQSADKIYHLESSYFTGLIGEGDQGSNYLFLPTEYAIGFIQPQARGALIRQGLKFKGWRGSYLDMGLFEGSSESLGKYALLTQPLHPRFSGGLKSWQNYLEAGYYRDQNYGASMISRVFFDFGLSTQFEAGWREGLALGLTLQWTPSISTRWSFLEVGLLPRQRQAFTYDAQGVISQRENHRFHEAFLNPDKLTGRLENNGQYLHKLNPDELCELYPQNTFCLKRFDEDLDGVGDEFDKCIDLKEDRDGFEDGDGCPDDDNDGDRVPDVLDKCPDVPEDRDGAFDQDGCPEGDNDGDGLSDYDDLCPNEAEDKDYFQDDDGCPELDNDGDGINDLVDVCPNSPEDLDGVEDKDGCPDSKDDDSLDESMDLCPDETEDLDGFRDDDGCLDADNDLDEIPDLMDKCPNEREIYNSVKDQDGCPD